MHLAQQYAVVLVHTGFDHLDGLLPGLRLMYDLLGGPLFHLVTRGEPDRLDILSRTPGVTWYPTLAFPSHPLQRF